ncbi:MAG: MBL fold metallo-hydrolase [Lachnospiraceae bacterium]|jgi:glyoxylase-like metal-dependent hydrolase (beta-lactamase superfamily II)|nr:MBL fold metallo-hydrolase [Lachnospiraceae bacterium]
MTEIYPGLFQIQLCNGISRSTIINIFLIPGKDSCRSLMIDTGYRTKENKKIMDELLIRHRIRYDDLDIFLTHKHHDHTGLANFYADRGARIFMNPEEDRHLYDCLYYNNNPQAMEEQVHVLSTVGITEEKTPVLWKRFMELNRQIQQETKESMFNELKNYRYIPIRDGMKFSYGDYHLNAIHLKGHTYGQMGLIDKEHHLVFPADQLIDGIVPIVGTAYPDEHLLDYYFRSLENFKALYKGYMIHPAHKRAYRCDGTVPENILDKYTKKLDKIRQIVQSQNQPMTIREVAFLAYGAEDEFGWKDIMQTKMIISKTFSCLEYLYDKKEISRTWTGETLYWGKI